jgi:hypothetical protein
VAFCNATFGAPRQFKTTRLPLRLTLNRRAKFLLPGMRFTGDATRSHLLPAGFLALTGVDDLEMIR